MIDCPLCGARTSVTETRQVGTSTRRRRRCTVASCKGRVTTVEVVVNVARGSSDLAAGNTLVPTRQLARLKKIVAAITGGDV